MTSDCRSAWSRAQGGPASSPPVIPPFPPLHTSPTLLSSPLHPTLSPAWVCCVHGPETSSLLLSRVPEQARAGQHPTDGLGGLRMGDHEEGSQEGLPPPLPREQALPPGWS